MTALREASRGLHKDAGRIIDYAAAHGWQGERTGRGRLKLTKPGSPIIITHLTAGCWRAWRNTLARLKRIDRELEAYHARPS